MADIVSPEVRSRMMSAIRSRNTKPELAVRRFFHGRGLRFRLHAKNLPGRPDVVLPKYRAVVFVHGCFWHRHTGCRFSYNPKSRRAFWRKKFLDNIQRDRRRRVELEELGWKVLTIWECETSDENTLEELVIEIRTGETQRLG
jgi:DNA mismatch endonuclease (patch repair protein)